MRNPGQPLPDHAAILATLSRSTPADPSSVGPGTVVRIAGVARPGPQGTLTAPFSGRPCVWFRVLEVRHDAFGPVGWNAGYLPPPVIATVVASDMGFGGRAHVDDESRAPFAVVGPAGGVLVDPVRADVSTRLVSVDSVEGQWRFTDYVLRREWLLEDGAAVFAVGPVATPGEQPVLRATPTDCAVISTSGEAGVFERARSTLAYTAGRGSGRGLIIGLIAGAVALFGLIAVVLLVLG